MLGRLLRFSAGIVHRSFRRFEHFADWLTGAAGPVFIVICWVLVGMGAWAYFTTMFSALTPLPTSFAPLWEGRVSMLTLPLLTWNALVTEPLLMMRFTATLAVCLFIGYSVFFHYYMATTEPPGGVMTGLSPALNEHRLGTGSTRWWLEKRKRIARDSPVSLRAHSDLVVVPSKPIRLLKAKESSERQARARQEHQAAAASHPFASSSDPVTIPASSQRPRAPAALVSPPAVVPTSSSSVPLSSSPRKQESVLPQPLPRQSYSLCIPPGDQPQSKEPRRAATPDASLERDMYSAHGHSHGSKGQQLDDLAGPSSRAGHRTGASLGSMPPRNRDALVAPKPRVGAIHHMPTMPMNKGFQFPPGNALTMATSNSYHGAPSNHGRFNSSPRSSIDTTSTTFVGGAGAAAGADPLLEDIDSDDLFPVAKMCHKCPKVPLFKALAALPPEMRSIERAIRSKHAWPPRPRTLSRQDSGSEDETSPDEPQEALGFVHDETEEDVRAWLGEEEAWQLVPPPKPERAHHCSVCKTCILKYDHHCPWLNQCVGLGNERYFVLFMAWLAVACIIISGTGFPVARHAFYGAHNWSHPYTPRVCVMLTWTLALVIGLGVGVMAAWQVLLVARGETSVESHDNQHYDMLARRRGQRFQNVYDLGAKQNLRLFFNTPDDGEPASASGRSLHMRTSSVEALPEREQKDDFTHVFLPIRIAPYSDGWHWAKRRGLGGRHAGIETVEELTDDEEDYS